MEENNTLAKRLKLVVAAIIVGFIIQEILIYNVFAEPYPALRMPPFAGNNMNSEGRYQTSSVDIKIYFDSGDSLTIKPKLLFEDAPNSHHNVLTKKFKLTAEEKNDSSYPKILQTLVPGYYVSRSRSLYEVQHAPETKCWLRTRIEKIAPGKTPTMISFQWFQEQYDTNDLLAPTRTFVGNTNIQLL